jgi:hypothetical protein
MAAKIARLDASSTRMMVDIVLSEGYTNNADVAACQVSQSFGGGICDPTSEEIDIFNAINSVRTAPADHTATVQAIVDSFSGFTATYDFNGDGTAESKGFAAGSTYWSDAKTAIAAISGLSAF